MFRILVGAACVAVLVFVGYTFWKDRTEFVAEAASDQERISCRNARGYIDVMRATAGMNDPQVAQALVEIDECSSKGM